MECGGACSQFDERSVCKKEWGIAAGGVIESVAEGGADSEVKRCYAVAAHCGEKVERIFVVGTCCKVANQRVGEG